MLLHVENISKSYKISGEKLKVLSHLSLSAERGEMIAITGKSGCGKSTLLNIINGLCSPDEGKIFIDDKKIHHYLDLSMSSIRNKRIGQIFQTFRLLDEETVLSNILLPARIKGKVNKETITLAHNLLEQTGMLRHKNQKAALLSGGQKQRVAIVRALINNPDIILADEPTANLDQETAKEIFKLLMQIKGEGRCLIIVTHDSYMLKRADRSYIMENGQLFELSAKSHKN